MAAAVSIWWAALCAVSALNLGLWAFSLAGFRRTQPNVGTVNRWPHLVLSGVYVLGCAFRSLLPRADVQRIVLYDSFLSSVLVGRSVATIAELCFVAQWALLLHELSRAQVNFAHAPKGALRHRFGVRLSYAIVPMITVAEICSWYAVLSTNYLGNALEQSIWTLTALLVTLALVPHWTSASGKLRWFLGAVQVLCLGFVAFMCTVDVPMYLTRWRADVLSGRSYMPLREGLRDIAQRWVVTHSWADWHQEIAWMSLYFSLAVWLSIALTHAPRADGQRLMPVRAGRALRTGRNSSAPA